jgi:UDP-N-acetylmuramoyl-tripeptide--D-alanyl-D-alanine ligase
VNLPPAEIAAALGAEVVAEGSPGPPRRAVIDSGQAGPGDLFFGLRGEKRDGGDFAPAAIEAGAWGVVVGPGGGGGGGPGRGGNENT